MKKSFLLSCAIVFCSFQLHSQELSFLKKFNLNLSYRSYQTVTNTEAFGQYALSYDREDYFGLGVSYDAFQWHNTGLFVGFDVFRAPIFSGTTSFLETNTEGTLPLSKNFGYALDPVLVMEIPIGVRQSFYLTEESGINVMAAYQFGYALISDETVKFNELRDIQNIKFFEVECSNVNRFNHSTEFGAGVFFNTKKLHLEFTVIYNLYFTQIASCQYKFIDVNDNIVTTGSNNPNWNNLELSIKIGFNS